MINMLEYPVQSFLFNSTILNMKYVLLSTVCDNCN